jgi:hypothetical protein
MVLTKKEEVDKDLWCHYSNLPSPLSYTECVDYDGIGNHGRFPNQPKNKKRFLIQIKRKKHE